MGDKHDYLRLVVASLVRVHEMDPVDAWRAARGFVLDCGDELPSGDAAALIATQKWQVTDRRTQF